MLGASFHDDTIAWYENDGSAELHDRTRSAPTADGAIACLRRTWTATATLDVLSASYDDDKIAWYENLNPLDGDFNDDGVYDCLDINLLTTAVATRWIRRPV